MEDRAFGAPLEFEREDYRVRLNSQKTLRLFAKVREVVSHRAEVALSSHDGSTVSVRSRCVLEPVAGTNYALAECPVRGKRLKAKTVVRASVNGYEASAEVKVIERSEDRAGPRIQIELCNEDFGNFRAQWGDHEGRPNVLRIAGRHASLARYLGAPGEGGNFPHQESPLYRVLLAEIVAEAVCRKSLRLEARERPWDFRWADLKDDFVISDTVVSQLKRRLREFLPIAHRAMVEPRDAKQPVFIGAG